MKDLLKQATTGCHVLKVSVIIPTYNYARFVGQAIENALGQTLPPTEVIVVDDGSTDDTAIVLASFGDRIRVVWQQNRGVAAARNAGAALATGGLLAFLDADDLWLPRKLERQVARFQAAPDLGLVHCGMEEIDADGVALGQRLDGLEGRISTEMLLFRRGTVLGGGSGAVVARLVFEAIGGFDEQLSTSADWDLYYRIAAVSEVGFVPEILLRYRIHGANMHANFHAMEHDMLLAFKKAFRECPVAEPLPRSVRRRGYGNLHRVLAGSFFSTGDYHKFMAHAVQSLLLTPPNLLHFVGYPVRWWQRRMADGKNAPGSRRAAQTGQW